MAHIPTPSIHNVAESIHIGQVTENEGNAGTAGAYASFDLSFDVGTPQCISITVFGASHKLGNMMEQACVEFLTKRGLIIWYEAPQ